MLKDYFVLKVSNTPFFMNIVFILMDTINMWKR